MININNTFPYRMMQFFHDETKGEHLQRMKRAEMSGRNEPNIPLKMMIIEQLVMPDKIQNLSMVFTRLNMKLVEKKGFGVNSFFIENI